MRAHDSRRALRLASMLAVAGLALTAAPHALAAGADADASVIKLTGAQGKALADRLQTELYGDDAASTDGTGATTGTGATDGTGTGRTDAPTPDASGGASTDTVQPITTTRKSTIEGVRGLAATVPVGNRKGDYFTLHSLGHVARSAADGTPQWSRDIASLTADWKVKHLRPWDTEFYPPLLMMGYNAVSPFTPNSGQGYDTGDLTGDGIPDVAFSASLGMVPPAGVVFPGTTLTKGTIVTVLDGATGKTLYSKVYAFASLVKIVDGALLVGDAPSENGSAAATGTTRLTGTRFSYADGALTESSTWMYDTGTTTGSNWASVQDLGGGRAAVSWDLAKTATSASRGRTVVLDTNDGSVQWQTDSSLYSRQLRLDTGRGQLVAVEQSDISDGVRYEVAAYDLADGRRTTLDGRVNVLPTAFTVGDLSGDTADEYIVSESSLTDNLFVNASTIRVLDGGDPQTALWQYTTKRAADNGQDGPSTWRLDVVGNRLVATGQDDTDIGKAVNTGGRYGSLTVFNAKGKVAWRTSGATASPVFDDIYKDADGRHIRTVDADQNVRTYDLADGTRQQLSPLQGDMAYAQMLDMDGDKKLDLVEGGQSDGVWAYSGTSLVGGTPKKLWQATVPGAVHRIEVADVTGDKTPEIVVAADSAVVVLDSSTGAVLRTIDGGSQYVRSVVLADLDGDGKKEILVPTDALRVYKGDGKPLWTYAAPASAGSVYFADPSVNDGRVYTQYGGAGAFDVTNPVVKAVALDGATGTLGWDMTPTAPADAQDGIRGALLDHAVYASANTPYADGHAVAYTWVAWTPIHTTSGDFMSPSNVVEIRDGRTGELLHTATTGGLWTHGGYFDGDGVLMEAGTASVYSFGAGGADTRTVFLPPTHTAGWITGPGGRKVGITGSEGGAYLWDPATFVSDGMHSDYVGKTAVEGGSRNYVAGDLDGDGVDEIVMLNFDDRGVNETAEMIGGGYLISNQSIHEVSTYKLS
ncbi:FG-GAP-like repeat-containing protein [Peterkaempfera sp. SMS 1(5)a]|uniref:FG-GAP-like repeat-containing protein n=1 Tax=Peterkaempfera podocarpi TaxID=3232308 RepID=UPI00366C940E